MKVLDQLRADHPNPDVERTLVLVAGPEVGPLIDGGSPEIDIDSDFNPDLTDFDRIEAWDSVFRAHLDDGGGDADRHADRHADEVTIAFRVAEPTRLATLFHAAATWLGLVGSRLRSVHLHVDETADEHEMAAAFAREKERHLHLHEIDLPEVDWLPEQHQYEILSKDAWDYASSAERPEGLSVRQLFAIRLYTSEFYLAFHKALRPGRGDHPVYREVMPIIACLDAALENLPPVADTTFRGERYDSYMADSRRALEAGSEFHELSYVSSSRNELHSAALRRGFLFRIRGRTGREVSQFSQFPWEQEVLFGRGLIQRVLSKDCSEWAIGDECDFETEEVVDERLRFVLDL